MDLRPLRREELAQALARIHSVYLTDRSYRGFRTLTEEPALYNKWLYTTEGRGCPHTLLGLSRCFCPITDRPYLDVRTYSPLPAGNAPQSELFSSLTELAVGLLELPAGHDMVGIVRGSFGVPDHPYGIVFDENTSQSEHFGAIVFERVIDPGILWTARDRIRWRDETGPVWDGEVARVRLAASLDQHLLYQHEVCINEEISFPMPSERIRRGIQRVVTHSERHGHLTMFDRGAYLIAERNGSPLGSAWCFRSFDPAMCGWIVWVRRPYVREGCRKKAGCSVDVFELIIRAAVGLFAEAGYPARVRTLCPRSSMVSRALTRVGFSVVEDEERFIFTI